MRCAACGEETGPAVCVVCGEEARVGGRYRLDAVVGQGASGTVYRGVDVQTGAAVAVKEMGFRLGADAKTRDLVAREGRVLRQLQHPGIPRWIDEVVAGSGRARALFLVQEFVEGRTLADELAAHRWSEDEALDLMAEVLPILEYLHTRHPPVIHRDLKPGNLIRRADGALVLVDFGAVRDVLASARGGGSTVAGTFGYMAPEQFRGHAEPATDLYALGVSVVGLLSRQDPAALHDRAGRLRWEAAVAVSPGTHALLAALLAPDPDARPSSAAAAHRWVRSLQSGERGPPGPAPVAPPPAAARPSEARREARTLHAQGRAPGRDLPPPFEPPVHAPHPGAVSHRRVPRAGRDRRVLVVATALLVLLAGAVAAFLTFSVAAPEPARPQPAIPRVMPEQEVRPVPELQGNALVPAADPRGASRCIMLGGALGAHRDALPVATGTELVRVQPEMTVPEDFGEAGERYTCALRFAVDPTGRPAEVAITAEGCPDPLQVVVCDAAEGWRFAVPDGAEEAGGFTTFARVVFSTP